MILVGRSYMCCRERAEGVLARMARLQSGAVPLGSGVAWRCEVLGFMQASKSHRPTPGLLQKRTQGGVGGRNHRQGRHRCRMNHFIFQRPSSLLKTTHKLT